MHISEKITQRRSCRAFLDKPIEKDIVVKLLEVAKWAPSAGNHQPVTVVAVSGDKKLQLAEALMRKVKENIPPNPDYIFPSTALGLNYKERRKSCGRAMYGALNITEDDVEAKKAFKEKNYNFFYAPVGLIICMEKNMPQGSWIDTGMFIQNILLGALDFGLASCPQGSIAEYPDIVREVLGMQGVDIICGIALGYPDVSHPVNNYPRTREPLSLIMKWYE